jgi:hypothetical protein
MGLLMKFLVWIYFHPKLTSTSPCTLFIPTLRIHKTARPLLAIDLRGIFNVEKDQLLTFYEWVLCYPLLLYPRLSTYLYLYINFLICKDRRPCSPSIISTLIY